MTDDEKLLQIQWEFIVWIQVDDQISFAANGNSIIHLTGFVEDLRYSIKKRSLVDSPDDSFKKNSVTSIPEGKFYTLINYTSSYFGKWLLSFPM